MEFNEHKDYRIKYNWYPHWSFLFTLRWFRMIKATWGYHEDLDTFSRVLTISHHAITIPFVKE